MVASAAPCSECMRASAVCGQVHANGCMLASACGRVHAGKCMLASACGRVHAGECCMRASACGR
eukprot:4436202-Pleurochrysis_carterae.AAC.1